MTTVSSAGTSLAERDIQYWNEVTVCRKMFNAEVEDFKIYCTVYPKRYGITVLDDDGCE